MPHTHHDHSNCLHTAMEKAEALCSARKLRLTDGRKAVLKALWQSHKAMTAAEITAKVKAKQPPLTYRALAFLREQGLVHHIGALDAYVGCPRAETQGHVSQLFVCRDCRDVEEIPAPGLERSLRSHAEQHGFTMQETHLEVLGICQNCKA